MLYRGINIFSHLYSTFAMAVEPSNEKKEVLLRLWYLVFNAELDAEVTSAAY